MRYDVLDEKKALLDQHRPLPEALVQNLDEWFRVELTYTSNAIEGNTLTRRETALVVEKGLTVGGKSLTELCVPKTRTCWPKQTRGQDLEPQRVLGNPNRSSLCRSKL
jgi:hypothetical protein